MKMFICGLLVLPAMWLLIQCIGILRRTVRDSWKWRRVELKPGYSRWCWVCLVPVIFWNELKTQCGAWWNGYSVERDVSPIDD